MTEFEQKQRNKAIWEDYLKSLEYRQQTLCHKHGITLSRFKQIIAEQKKLHN